MGVASPPPPTHAGHYGYPHRVAWQVCPSVGGKFPKVVTCPRPVMAGVPAAGGLASPEAANSNGAVLPALDEMDLSIQCDPKFLRPTVSRIVGSQAAANASKIPLGVTVCPMAGDVGTSNEDVDVVDFGSTGIVRCKRCRTYINPFVVWTDGGRRWRCNMCGMLNDVPSSYFSQLDSKGIADKLKRPELSKCSVEFVATVTTWYAHPSPRVLLCD